MRGKIIIFVGIIILLTQPVFAGTYYVSPTGAATWANCEDAAGTPGPKEGAAACALSTANANADDDDIVYLRVGTYTILTSTTGVCPVNSGTAGHIITFSGYAAETVTLHGTDDATVESPTGINFKRWVAGDWIGNSYVKITKMTIENMATSIQLYASSYNEFSYLTIKTGRNTFIDYPNSQGIATGTVTETTSDGKTLKYADTDASATRAYQLGILYNATDKSMCRVASAVPSCSGGTCTRVCDPSSSYVSVLTYGTANQWTIGDTYEIHPEISNGSVFISNDSLHNWIHHNTIYGYGQYGLKDGGAIMELGGVGTVDDHCNYNTVEDNHLYWGGHHVLGVNGGQYNVIARNNIHNEAWYDDSTYLAAGCGATKCGYRSASSSTTANHGGYNIWEGNRIGYGAAYGSPHLGTGASGSGMSLGTGNNIYRYNDHFFNALYGLRFSTSFGSTKSNRAYNNTFYKNGYGSDDDPAAAADYRGGVYMLDTDCDTIGDGGQDQVVKNNLFYYQWASSADNTGTKYPPVYLYNDGYPSTKPNCNTNFGGQTDTTDPKFTDADITTPASIATLPDLSLQPESPAINGGTYLTQANGAAAEASDTLVVDDASYFQDGSWGSSLATLSADVIAIGTVANIHEIASINYATNTITLSTSTTWADDASVWLYSKSDAGVVLVGAAPDYGSHEYASEDEVGPWTVTVANGTVGANTGSDASPVGDRIVADGDDLVVTCTIRNGWKATAPTNTCNSAVEGETGVWTITPTENCAFTCGCAEQMLFN